MNASKYESEIAKKTEFKAKDIIKIFQKVSRIKMFNPRKTVEENDKKEIGNMTLKIKRKIVSFDTIVSFLDIVSSEDESSTLWWSPTIMDDESSGSKLLAKRFFSHQVRWLNFHGLRRKIKECAHFFGIIVTHEFFSSYLLMTKLIGYLSKIILYAFEDYEMKSSSLSREFRRRVEVVRTIFNDEPTRMFDGDLHRNDARFKDQGGLYSLRDLERLIYISVSAVVPKINICHYYVIEDSFHVTKPINGFFLLKGKSSRYRLCGTAEVYRIFRTIEVERVRYVKGESGSHIGDTDLIFDSISSKTLSPLDLEPLKSSKEEFFQIGSCSEIAPRMVKCRSCRQNNNNTSNSAPNTEPSTSAMDEVSSIKSGSKDSSTTAVVSSFCRFHGFRKLQFSAKGTLTHAGFCKSNEADAQDLSLWRMYQPLPSELSVAIATYLVKSLSSIFCEIIDAENKFLQDTYQFTENSDNRTLTARRIQTNTYASGHKSDSIGFVWKRPVQGVREMCDVCETSIFNTHWACRKCGYSICVDCFNERNDMPVAGSTRVVLQQEFKEKENDSIQIKTTNLNKTAVHLNTRGANKNRYFSCSHPWAVCTANRQQHNPDQMLKVELIPIRVINELRNRMHTVAKLLQINLRCNCLTKSKTDAGIKLSKQLSLDSIPAIEKDHLSSGNFDLHMLADIALKEVVSTENKTNVPGECNEQICLTGVPRPPPVLSPPHHPENGNYTNNNNQESKLTDGNVTVYSWLNVTSNFKMIHLHNAQSSENLRLFQQEWLQAHPVLISGCHATMDLSLWTPEKFLEEFESEPALLVDCETGFPVPRATMKSFWEGFDCFDKRISSSEGSSKPACLKLKDWPPSDDFNDVLPQRCKDILSNLPIKEYTSRQGEFNLAAHLPEFFVCPDLGPKLYNAYGMPRESKLGTTNLHLDIADAVNVMLYVGVPSDNSENETENTFESMREANVDKNVINRSETELPGALWHIFLPKHVPKLRQFLNNIINERGESIGANQDPIHDQLFYLNQPLLDRLKEETSIEGCAIVQFRGDAVFIPAGAPHQVRNLHSCMKVANDFVSPENILNCLLVTKEFRQLSSTHANHEDKLQAKNMIFHAVKDAVSTLIVRNSHAIADSNGRQREHTIKRKRSNQTDDKNTMPWSASLTKEESRTAVEH